MQHPTIELKSRQRPTSILITPTNKRIFYYLENKPFDSRIIVRNGGFYVTMLNAFFYDRFKTLENDPTVAESILDRYTEKLPLLVTTNFHITERSTIRFNRLIEDAFVEHIVRIELALKPYVKRAVSRNAIIANEMRRAEIDDLIEMSALQKACSRRILDLNISPRKVPTFG